MRLLHTADLHLGRQFMGLGLEEDHEAVLGQIVETLVAERVDVLVIAGDVFDRASPPIQRSGSSTVFSSALRKRRKPPS